jgi:hypothetical protein
MSTVQANANDAARHGRNNQAVKARQRCGMVEGLDERPGGGL